MNMGNHQQKDYEEGLWGRTNWAQILALPVTSYGSASLFVKIELIDNTSFEA